MKNGENMKSGEESIVPEFTFKSESVSPRTVGELRRFLESFDDECPLRPLGYGAFHYVIDGEGNGLIDYY